MRYTAQKVRLRAGRIPPEEHIVDRRRRRIKAGLVSLVRPWAKPARGRGVGVSPNPAPISFPKGYIDP